MCKAPKPPKPKPAEKPEFLRNPYLDAAIGQSAVVSALRTGRSSLRIPLGSGLRIPGTQLSPPSGGSVPRVNPSAPNIANVPPPRGDFRGIAGRAQQ